MKRSIAVGLLLAATMAGIAQIADKAGSSSTLPASAPTTTRAAESEKVRDIRQLLELMHEREQIQIQLDSQLESLRQRLPNIPEESWRELAKELPADELLDMFVPLFEKHLSEEDVKAAIEFAISPAGKRLNAAMPQIVEDYTRTRQKSFERYSLKLAEIRKRAASQPAAE